MISKIKNKMMSDKLYIRIITTYLCFLFLFTVIVILSYFLLPEGFLRGKNSLHDWEESPKEYALMFQIFFYNMLSVIALLIANLFRSRKNENKCFFPLGYVAFFVMISLNAVTLGTWSFSVVSEAVPLVDRIIRTFDLAHRAGLWEMSGQLLIVCATVNISLIITEGKTTTTKSFKTIRLSKGEISMLVLGFLLMLIGAYVESHSIINLS